MNNKIVSLMIGLSLLGVAGLASADNHSEKEMMYNTTSMEMNNKSELIENSIGLKMMISKSDYSMVESVVNKYYSLTRDFNSTQMRSINNRFVKLLDESMNPWLTQRSENLLNLVKHEILTKGYKWTYVWENRLSSFSNIGQNAMNTGMHDTLVTALVEANLANTLMEEGPFTVFAPVDSAFEELPEGTVENLLMEENREVLTDILTYHVVSGVYLSSDLSNWLTLETINGEMIEFSYMDDKWYVNGEEIVLADVQSSNGLIHAIDWVLMPQD